MILLSQSPTCAVIGARACIITAVLRVVCLPQPVNQKRKEETGKQKNHESNMRAPTVSTIAFVRHASVHYTQPETTIVHYGDPTIGPGWALFLSPEKPSRLSILLHFSVPEFRNGKNMPSARNRVNDSV